ncbi:hypothetical protein PLICRDRAFT_302114 [Plicaturopsis crispa FD-325 SS-3]|nr:hypothetical protein PLICRDRAFT_302114 [Plicaturopsis crispa FD-325 SS-3]
MCVGVNFSGGLRLRPRMQVCMQAAGARVSIDRFFNFIDTSLSDFSSPSTWLLSERWPGILSALVLIALYGTSSQFPFCSTSNVFPELHTDDFGASASRDNHLQYNCYRSSLHLHSSVSEARAPSVCNPQYEPIKPFSRRFHLTLPHRRNSTGIGEK